MSRGIFPVVQPETESTYEQLPLAKEIAWDFSTNQPIISGGEPLIVTGAEAVKVWCWLALQTPRRRHPEIYTWDYGHDLEDLVGRPYNGAVKESEAIRCVKEAVEINPYVTGIQQVNVTFSQTTLQLNVIINTIYGEVSISV